MKTKICTKCELEKPIDEFVKNGNQNDGYTNDCKLCYNIKRTKRYRKDIRPTKSFQKYLTLDAKEDFKNGVKYCPGCKTKKPHSEFLKNPVGTNGIDFHCIECKRKNSIKYGPSPEEKHQYYLKDKKNMRNKKLLKKYGITLDDYYVMLSEQNNKCAICGKTPEEQGKDLAVDHCHTSNKVRALLCNNCNVAIGFLKDNVDITKKIMYYLIKHKTN